LYYLILGTPILAAGLIKFYNPGDFASSLKYSFYFTDWLSILIAVIIPVIEIILGASLILNSYRHISIIIYRFLLGFFFVFHIWNNILSGQKPCNCFGNLVEFDGILMMIIILALLGISFIPYKSEDKKDSFYSHKKNISKKNIVVVVSVAILIFAAGHTRWLRIERELDTGLLSSKNALLLNEKIKQHFSDLKFDKPKYKIVLFLKSPTCSDCIQQLLFWNNPQYLEKFSIVGVFSETIDTNLQIIKNYYSLNICLYKMPYDLWKQMIGLSLAYSNLLLLDKNNTYAEYTVFSNMEELKEYAQKIENIKD